MRAVSRAMAATLIASIVLCAGSRDIRGESSADSKEVGAKCFVGVARLFQKGEKRVDLESVKRLLLACEAADDVKKPFRDQSEEFHNHWEAFFEYMDTHKLEASDIQDLRDWACSSLDAREGDPRAVLSALAFRLSRSLGRVWIAVQAEEGRCAPRHAILCSVISDTPRSLRHLVSSVGVIRREQGERQSPGADRLRTMERFLLDKQNEVLWSEIQQDAAILERLAIDGQELEADDLVQLLLDSKNSPEKFQQAINKFLPLSKKLLLGYPRYALPERFLQCRRMRAAWNIVHAFADNEAREKLEKHVLSLINHFEQAKDAVTAQWLRQVMDKPGTPVDQYVKIILLHPVKAKTSEK